MSWLSWCAAEIPPRSPAWSTRVGAGLEVVAYAAALQAVLVARGTARYYVNPAGDAVLAVSAGRSGWCLEDHVSARPGTGQGRALRAVVLPQLLAAADADRIEIHTTAATFDAREAVHLRDPRPGRRGPRLASRSSPTPSPCRGGGRPRLTSRVPTRVSRSRWR